MNFTQAIKSVFSNYANFSGRARRSEYWYFVLFSAIINLALIPVSILASEVGQIITTLIGLAILVPSLAVLVRRLHDVGKSGWYYFGFLIIYIILLIICCITAFVFSDLRSESSAFGIVGVIPMILLFFGVIGYSFYLLYLMCNDSQIGENRWGANPKGVNPDSSNF